MQTESTKQDKELVDAADRRSQGTFNSRECPPNNTAVMFVEDSRSRYVPILGNSTCHSPSKTGQVDKRSIKI